MIEVSWEQLMKNSESKEITFERFNFQIAYKKYSKYGYFEYDYNTPGSEFYLTLTKECEELEAKAGDVVGWQAKFWVNRNDMNNTSLDVKHRQELIEGLKSSMKYKANLKTWIICTPGQPSNTEPYKPKETLIKEIHNVNSQLNIFFWNKPVYEAFQHEDTEKLSSIFSHYFSHKFLGFEYFKDYSEKRIKLLSEKYDIELYTEGKVDVNISSIINYKTCIDNSSIVLSKLRHNIDDIKKNEHYS